MACELHHNVRRDAVGEGEADEDLSAGMSADEFVLGIDLVVSGAVSVAGDGVRLSINSLPIGPPSTLRWRSR